ncbi:MAG: hypothetical protein AAF298_19905 [Cyanobacteria bacterium P01_A01_bin.40]
MGQRPKIACLSVLGLLSAAGVVWQSAAINYGQWLAAGASNPQGDMSVLLSGSNERLETLLKLYNEGNVAAVYYAAGIDETVSDLEQYRNILEQYNIPSQDLYCGELVASTFNEAQAFKRKLQEVDRPVKKLF